MPFVEAELRYQSSVDATRELYAKTCRDTAFAGPMPLLVVMHGFSEGADAIVTSVMQSFASYGFGVASLGMRGRNDSTNVADYNGRELYDVLDGLDAVRASALGPFLSAVNCFDGYSGGGGNALGLISRAPSTFSVLADFFGISDYGKDPTDAWYFSTYVQVTNPAVRAELDARVGSPTNSPGQYDVRSAIEAIADGLGLGSAHLYIYHDSADVTVPVVNSRRVATALAALPAQFDYSESQPADPVRWLHGYPNTSPDLVFAENGGGGWLGPIFVPAMLAAATFTVPSVRVAPYQVQGWIRADTPAGRFEVWAGSTPLPRGGGGEDRTIDLTWDVTTGTYGVTPLDGPAWVDMRQPGRHALVLVTAPTAILLGGAETAPTLARAILPPAQNLLQRSEDFGNAFWQKFQLTIASAATAPPTTAGAFGGSEPATADGFVEDGNPNQHATFVLVPPTVVGRIYTLRCYAKQGTRRWLCLIVQGAVRVYFDLQAGALGSVVQGVTGSFMASHIESLGTGWYLCEATYLAVAGNPQVNIEPENADGGLGYVGVNGNTAIFVTGASLTQANWPGAYQPTTNAVFDVGSLRNLAARPPA